MAVVLIQCRTLILLKILARFQKSCKYLVEEKFDGININNAQSDFIPSCENLIENNLIDQ